MMKNRIYTRVAIAVVSILTVLYVTPGYAWYYYAGADDRVWEEISSERETLPVGAVISSLPNGARAIFIEQTQYFVSGENWFVPIINEEGIKYQVVFAPV